MRRPLSRHAVPAWMVERATRFRLAGDWRGACAAANIDIGFDLSWVARRKGVDQARLVDDLRHLAPDLLRWHLPRHGGTGLLSPHTWLPLARYGDYELSAHLPAHLRGPQRVTLQVEPGYLGHRGRRDDSLLHHRDRWDARRTGELLTRCGGVTRLPFFTTGGARLTPGGDDPEGRIERILMLADAGRHAESWAAAGFDVEVRLFDPGWDRERIDPAAFDPGRSPQERERIRRRIVEQSLAQTRPALTVLAGRARRIAEADPAGLVRIYLRNHRWAVLDRLDGPRPRARIVSSPVRPADEAVPSRQPGEAVVRRETAEFGLALSRIPVLPRTLTDWPDELAALRSGRLEPDDLHPLVAAVLFPARTPRAPAATGLPRTVRVECAGTTHQVAMRDGEIAVPHPPAELDREAMLRALGGRAQGCFAARLGWRRPDIRMPHRMRAVRARLMRIVLHGDGPAVAALLDAGLDPHVRDEDGRTLLHLLPWLSGADLLPRLLAAGLDVDTPDAEGSAPFVHACRHGPEALVRQLLAAGASADARDPKGYPVIIRAEYSHLWRRRVSAEQPREVGTT
ncbi:ankyrin repeat domain-containing protein [Dactylosporangium sucinum]|uniref:Ankyrin repeat domain-containing protein n=1 Tax=Dactylosporangium sucinum TaxID=1424081 RepID=A0A917X0C2_9ACTN|nr:ankyrin repeat domain-containing protein [Dactylosporangium sucinum]GGM46220.1 hypothetical protein GCM10007977_054980 [Dactylosporangium sucinum]